MLNDGIPSCHCTGRHVVVEADNKINQKVIQMCDITGGNSGSRVMNANGELIGVAFDGNYESMISYWQYDCFLQRCIAVDIRYVMFITGKYGNADFLLKEMNIDL
jgi:hypothetical protein